MTQCERLKSLYHIDTSAGIIRAQPYLLPQLSHPVNPVYALSKADVYDENKNAQITGLYQSLKSVTSLTLHRPQLQNYGYINMANDFSNTTQSGFLLSEDERFMLNELKATDPVTKNEIRRLQILRETKLIETTDLDDLFQRYTHTIRRLFKVPIVAVTLVDLDRIYIKARVGVDGDMQAPRKGSFCNRILMEDTPTVCATTDARFDPRFAECLLNWPESFAVSIESPTTRTSVQAKTVPDKFIRFYASVALVVDNVRVGSLCLFDCVPRPDLVEKALLLLPDFGKIISESMVQRHKLLLGYGAELAELSMSVVYNLKYPIENLQKSFTNLGHCVAFQPSKRVTKVLLHEEKDPTTASAGVSSAMTYAMGRIQEEGSHSSGNSSSYSVHPHHPDDLCSPSNNNSHTNAMLSSPVSQDSGACRGAFSPESDDSQFSHAHHDNHESALSPTSPIIPVTNLELQVPLRCKKIVNFDLLQPEKELLVDRMLEVRQRTRALITVLAHSLSVAHDLQAQYHRQQESAVSTSYTAHHAHTSIAGKRPTDEACKEKIYAPGKLHSRLQRIQGNLAASALSNQSINYQFDSMLCGSATDPEPVKFQLNGKMLSLVMYSTMYHLSRVFNSKTDVNIRFEERDLTPWHVQLANRVGSPSVNGNGNGNNRKYIHGGMHRLCSPRSSKSSTKSTLDSGKVTRLPSFAMNMNNANFMVTLSGSSDGSISDAQQREILLLHSRRSSLEEGCLPGELHTQLLNNINNTTISINHPLHGASTNTTPSDKLYPLPNNNNTGASVFTSPRASVRKNSHGKHNLICGDIYITYKCPLPRVNAFSTHPEVISVSEKSSFTPDARVENCIFENVILRNILSTAQGGFCSSTGSEYFPDPPHPVLSSSLAVFANGGMRGSTMTETNPSSLKMPRYEAISEVLREDLSEGEYYLLTVRIPCNAYTTNGHGSTSTPVSGLDTIAAVEGSKQWNEASIHKKLHALTPIQSLRHLGSSGSTAALSCGTCSESNHSSLRPLPFDCSSNSIDGSSPLKPSIPVLFGVQHQYKTHPSASSHTASSDDAKGEKNAPAKFRPVFNLFSPRSVLSDEANPDETPELPFRQKHESIPHSRKGTTDDSTPARQKEVKRKPAPSVSNKGIGKSMSLLVQSVAHSLFGIGGTMSHRGHTGAANADGTPTTSTWLKSMRSVDVRVVPSPQQAQFV